MNIIRNLLIFIFFCSCQTNSNHLEIYENLDFHEYFTKVNIIPLETTEESLIGTDLTWCEFKMNRDKLFVLDKENSAFYIFCNDGQFVSKNELKGNGPGESNDFTDFIINRYTGNIEFLSNLGKICIYDDNLNFINEIEAPAFCRSFELVSKTDYIFYSTVYKNRLSIYSIDDEKILKEWFQIEENTPFNSLKTPFILHNDSVFFIDTFNGKLDLITQKGACQYWRWDFGKLNLDVKTIPKNKDIPHNVRWFQNLKDKAYLFNSKISNHYIYSSFRFNNKLSHVFVNKSTKDTLSFNQINHRKFKVSLLNDSCVVAFIEPINKYHYIAEQMLDQRTYNIFSNIDDFQNPIIIRYHFK